jgi:acetyl esterase/lipase
MTTAETHVQKIGKELASLDSLPLWPDKIPGAIAEGGPETVRSDGMYFITNIHEPRLYVMLPSREKANGTAVVICPGGAYSGLAIDHEGLRVGEWLNSLGVAAFVLKNRCVPYRHPYPLMDAQRAIRIVRHNSTKWNVATDRVGILGFSAGGHLASTASTHFDDGNQEAKDPIEKNGCRPDFSVLGYPVISFQEPFGHAGCRNNLIGEDAPVELVKLLSNELQVHEKTPPAFFFHSKDDEGVTWPNSEMYHEALKKHSTATELVLFETGGHGYGLGRGESAAWPKACEEWLRGTKFIP